MGAPVVTQVAASVPFDNSSNDFLATDVQAAIEESYLFQPSRDLITYDDTWFSLNWSGTTSGTGAQALQGGGNATLASGKHNGVMSCATGTTTTGRAAFRASGTQQGSLVVGNGKVTYESLIYIDDLATVDEDYDLAVGLTDANAGTYADGIYFFYDRASSANWQLVCVSASTATTVTTSTAVVADAWIKLGWVCNTDATLVTFYVNGTSVGTISTNIPTTTGRGYGPLFEIIKSAGTTSRVFYADYFYYSKRFSARD